MKTNEMIFGKNKTFLRNQAKTNKIYGFMSQNEIICFDKIVSSENCSSLRDQQFIFQNSFSIDRMKIDIALPRV